MSAQAHTNFMARWLWKNSTYDELFGSPSNLKVGVKKTRQEKQWF